MPVCLPPAVSSSFLPTVGDTDEVESLLEEDEWLHVWVREQMKNHMAKVGEAESEKRAIRGADGCNDEWLDGKDKKPLALPFISVVSCPVSLSLDFNDFKQKEG